MRASPAPGAHELAANMRGGMQSSIGTDGQELYRATRRSTTEADGVFYDGFTKTIMLPRTAALVRRTQPGLLPCVHIQSLVCVCSKLVKPRRHMSSLWGWLSAPRARLGMAKACPANIRPPTVSLLANLPVGSLFIACSHISAAGLTLQP